MNDDELSEMLNREIPDPAPGYWDRIDASLTELAPVQPIQESDPARHRHIPGLVAAENLGRMETDRGDGRPMVMDAITPNPSSTPGARWGLLALAAGAALIVGVLGTLALVPNNDRDNNVAIDTVETSTTVTTDDGTETDGADSPTEGDDSDGETDGSTSSSTTTPPTTLGPVARSFSYPQIGNVAFYNGLALAWWDGEAWIEMETGDGADAVAPEFAGGTVNYVAEDGSTISREVNPMELQCIEVGNNMWTVGDDESTAGLVGTSGDWPLRPRSVQEIGASAEHRESVAAVVRAAGVENPEVIIQKVIRVDIDGDGTDEVLISAENIVASGGAFGDLIGQPEGSYSMVLLRRVTPTGVETITLASFVVDADGADNGQGFGGFIQYSRLVDVADLNGDGIYEAVVSSGYYEGSSVWIYLLGDTPSGATAASCGV